MKIRGVSEFTLDVALVVMLTWRASTIGCIGRGRSIGVKVDTVKSSRWWIGMQLSSKGLIGRRRHSRPSTAVRVEKKLTCPRGIGFRKLPVVALIS